MSEKPPTTMIVPFGKYKGQPVETLRADRSYVDWLTAQDWFRQRHPNLLQIIVNNFEEPTETPEHNRLQARFLDNEFCYAFLSRFKIFTDPRSEIAARIARAKKRLESNVIYDFERRELAQEIGKDEQRLADFDADPPSKPYPIIFTQRFEVRGWDVVLDASLSMPRWEIRRDTQIYIEIKPSLGDDFPAVLRQMKANKIEVYDHSQIYLLMIDQFTAEGAKIEQVQQMFATENFGLVSFAAIENRIARQECS